MINCECGCQQPIYDAWRRKPPYYLTGHTRRVDCACGCGGVIEWRVQPRSRMPTRLPGHLSIAQSKHYAAARIYERPNRSGFCECGCGMPTPIAKTNSPSRGVFRGIPTRYLTGHQARGLKRGKGRYVNNQGYVLVRMPSHPQAHKGYVLEHRLVMEQHLHRALKPHELVHHLNGQKQDNRPDNLVLLTAGEHGKHHGRPPGIPVSTEHRRKLSEQSLRVWAERKGKP